MQMTSLGLLARAGEEILRDVVNEAIVLDAAGTGILEGFAACVESLLVGDEEPASALILSIDAEHTRLLGPSRQKVASSEPAPSGDEQNELVFF